MPELALKNIPLPQIKFGKHKERSTLSEVLTDDGRWVDREISVFHRCMKDDVWRMAWLLDPENQYTAEDNNWHQILSEESQVPICMRKESEYQDGENDEDQLTKKGNEIFIANDENEQAINLEKARTNEALTKFTWIISIVCGTMLIIATMVYFGGR